MKKVLTSQLRELEQTGILQKQIIKDTPPKIIIYEFNDEYRELIPLVNSYCDFSLHYAKINGIKIEDET